MTDPMLFCFSIKWMFLFFVFILDNLRDRQAMCEAIAYSQNSDMLKFIFFM